MPTTITELMTETIKGKSTVEVEHLFSRFCDLATGVVDDAGNLGKMDVFSGVRGFSNRGE